MTTKNKGKPPLQSVEILLGNDRDALQGLVREALEQILESEMTKVLGAAPGERSEERLGYRAGHCRRGLITRIGELELRVPRDRDGRFSTELFAR